MVIFVYTCNLWVQFAALEQDILPSDTEIVSKCYCLEWFIGDYLPVQFYFLLTIKRLCYHR